MNMEQQKIKVWDFPTRFFHWSMVFLLGGLWWTADVGEMQYHLICAYVLMTLIGFRFVWGLVGSETSQFKHFIVVPKQAIHYAFKQPKPNSIGHNPLGGYMVMLLLSLLALQLMSGLFATDEIFTEGPLVYLVSADTAAWLTWLHKTNFNIILAMVVIHVIAVLVHVIKGDNLVKAMLSGYKNVSSGIAAPKLRSPVLALTIVLVIFTLVWIGLLEPVVSFL